MKIIEFKRLSTEHKLLVVNSLISSNHLKPDTQALLKFVSKNKLYCFIDNDKLMACSGYKNLRGNIRLAILKNYSGSDDSFIQGIKSFMLREKGWTYRHDDCPKEVLVSINKLINKKLGNYKLFSLIEKTNERMLKSSEKQGFTRIMEIKSPNSERTLIVLYRGTHVEMEARKTRNRL